MLHIFCWRLIIKNFKNHLLVLLFSNNSDTILKLIVNIITKTFLNGNKIQNGLTHHVNVETVRVLKSQNTVTKWTSSQCSIVVRWWWEDRRCNQGDAMSTRFHGTMMRLPWWCCHGDVAIVIVVMVSLVLVGCLSSYPYQTRLPPL